MPSKPLLEERRGAGLHAGRVSPERPRGTLAGDARKHPGLFFLNRLARGALCIVLAGMVLLLKSGGAFAQAARVEPPAAMRFFLTEAPPASVLSELPPSARRAFVAKVRVVDMESTAPSELLLPPGDYRFPNPPPYAMRADLEVTAPVAGAHVWRRRQRVEFGPTGRTGVRTLFPLPPEREEREYFVVSFLDKNSTRTLLGFPVTREAYEAWYRERKRPHTR